MNFEIYNVEAAFVIFAKVAELSNKNCHYRTVRIQILSSTQVTFAFTNHRERKRVKIFVIMFSCALRVM